MYNPPRWDGKATLKLIRYISEFDDDGSETLWHKDVSGLSFDELAALLKDKGQIDLSKPPDWDPEDDEEQTHTRLLRERVQTDARQFQSNFGPVQGRDKWRASS